MIVLIQFLIVIGCILLGVRYGGLAIGVIPVVGLAVLVFGFGVTPTALPTDVAFIIICVCLCSAIMEACGGLDLLISFGAKIIRSNPNQVSIVAPLVSFALTCFAGTGLVCLALQPVTYEVAYNVGVRPERPLVGVTVASQTAITACPISAATAALLGLFSTYGHADIQLGTILMVTFPASLAGTLAAMAVFYFWGKELDQDEGYQARLKAGLIEAPKVIESTELAPGAKLSLIIFTIGIIYIVSAGFFPALRTPTGGTKPMGMSTCIEFTMMVAAGLMCLTSKPDLAKAEYSGILRGALVGVALLMGCTWLADSFVNANKPFLMDTFGALAQSQPWTFAIVLYIMSALMSSQGGTTRGVMPLGFALGLSPMTLVAMFPAVNGVFGLPISGIAFTAMGFDHTGTTTQGKYVYDNPFQIFGTIAALVAVPVGFLIVSVL
ncbi:MAG TPA: C4-dicarboxylate ABC transporter [Sutterella sp.]|nr:C4-dicarboxylate ABC transporter [Sutterella sp.]